MGDFIRSRRAFLAQASAMGAGLAFGAGPGRAHAAARVERRDLYPQGVASGDPRADSVILWTRRAPVRDAGYRQAGTRSVGVRGADNRSRVRNRCGGRRVVLA